MSVDASSPTRSLRKHAKSWPCIAAFATGLISATGWSAPVQAAPCPAGPKFFVVGVWVAPTQEMAKWRDRGVNTLIAVPQGHNVDDHHRAAQALGLKQIRPPRSKIEEDLVSDSVIAFMTNDEPSDVVGSGVRESPDQVSAQLKPWRDVMVRQQRCKPIFTNHVGNHIWFRNARVGLNMPEYHRRADWYGADTYQISAGDPNLLTQGGFTSTYQGHILTHQREMAPGAALLSFVQTAAIEAKKPVPTPGELKTQIWSSLVHGASMIGLFSVQLAPTFSFDATPPALVRVLEMEMKAIREIEQLIIDPVAGGTRPAEIFTSAPKGEPPSVGQLPYPFEARVIQADGRSYTIVINLSNERAALTYEPWNIANLEFEPNEVKHGAGLSWTAAPGDRR